MEKLLIEILKEIKAGKISYKIPYGSNEEKVIIHANNEGFLNNYISKMTNNGLMVNVQGLSYKGEKFLESSAARSSQDSNIELLEKKIAHLQKGRILETDPATIFKLDQQIKQEKAILEEFKQSLQ